MSDSLSSQKKRHRRRRVKVSRKKIGADADEVEAVTSSIHRLIDEGNKVKEEAAAAAAVVGRVQEAEATATATESTNQDEKAEKAEKPTSEEKKVAVVVQAVAAVDINALWRQNSTGGSVLCDLGHGSSMARIIASVKPVAQTSRDKRNDIIVTMLNQVLHLILTDADYAQVEIDDLQAMAPLSDAEQQQLAELVARRANDVAAIKQSILAQVETDIQEEVVAGLARRVKEIKQQRCNGAIFSLKDLDWIMDFFKSHVVFGDMVRCAINVKLQQYGIAIPPQ